MPKIYTRTGDRGDTGLWGGRRVSKNHPRVRAYGEVDELNTVLGLVLSVLPARKSLNHLRISLARIQEELFEVGAILATPPEETRRLTQPLGQGVPQAPKRLEREIDRMTAELSPLKRFIMPGGAEAAAWLHFARSVCRRAERETVALRERTPVPDSIIIYLNRLSDFLFTAARWVNLQLKHHETEWMGLAGRTE